MIRQTRRFFGWVPPALLNKAKDMKGTNVLAIKVVSYGNYPTRIANTTPRDSTTWLDNWVLASDTVIAAGGSATGAVYNTREDGKINQSINMDQNQKNFTLQTLWGTYDDPAFKVTDDTGEHSITPASVGKDGTLPYLRDFTEDKDSSYPTNLRAFKLVVGEKGH